MDKKLIESKISLLDKIKWKMKYKELDSILGKDSILKRGILKNRIIEEQHVQCKEDMLDILKRVKTQIPEKMNEIEEMMIQTLYKDYMAEKFPLKENDTATSNINDVIYNLNFMLNSRDLNKEGRMICEQLKIEDCKNRYMSLEIAPLLKYSEQILEKYPLDTLKKISTIPENDLKRMNGLQIENIIQATKEDIDTTSIYNYIKICKMQNYGSDVPNFLGKNMEYSGFFLDFFEKHGNIPSNDFIHDLFDKTRNMNAKETMMEFGEDDNYYKELRSKWFDFEIMDKYKDSLSVKKDLVTKKYFNIDFYDIKRIVEENKERLFSEETQKIIMYVKKIQQINNHSTLMNVYKELAQDDIGIDIGNVFDEIYNYYAMEKIEGCFKPEEFLGKRETIKYNGKDVQILKLQGEDYRGNVHVLGGRDPGGKNLASAEELENRAKYENPLLFSMLEGYSDNIALSTERDDAMAFFYLNKSSIVFGYSNLKPDNVLGYYAGDGGTPINGNSNYNKKIEMVNGEIDYNDKTKYDELLVSRYEDTNKIRKFRKDEKRILPDYILVFKGDDKRPTLNYDNLDELYTKRILEYATTYNIPIVEMDTEKYLEKYEKKYDDLFQKMKNGEEKFEMKDFEALSRYRRSISFYKDNDPRIKSETIFLKTVNDLNVTDKNSDTIKKIIEKFDSYNENWQNKEIAFLPEDEQQKTREKIQSLRKYLEVRNSNQEKETVNNEKSL